MLRVRTIMLAMLALVALSAFGAATATSAFAEDALVGIFQDPLTSKAAIGAYFTLKNIGNTKLVLAEKQGTVTCTGATGSGTVKETEKIEGGLTFTGCEAFGVKCNSGAEPVGTIVVPELTTLIGLEWSGTAWEPAALVGPLSPVTFKCGSSQTVTVAGSTVVLLPSEAWLGTNNEGRLFHVNFKQSSEGTQEGSGWFRDCPSCESTKDRFTVKLEGTKTGSFEAAQVGEVTLGSSEKVSIFS